MNPTDDTGFEAWSLEFELLARERDLEWLAACSRESRRKAFESGLSPSDELEALAGMSEWRGCGCGGS